MSLTKSIYNNKIGRKRVIYVSLCLRKEENKRFMLSEGERQAKFTKWDDYMFFFFKRNNLKSPVLLELNTNSRLFSFIVKGCLGKYKMVHFRSGSTYCYQGHLSFYFALICTCISLSISFL